MDKWFKSAKYCYSATISGKTVVGLDYKAYAEKYGIEKS